MSTIDITNQRALWISRPGVPGMAPPRELILRENPRKCSRGLNTIPPPPDPGWHLPPLNLQGQAQRGRCVWWAETVWQGGEG